MDKLSLRLLIITTFLLLTQTAFLKSQVTIASDQEMLVFHVDGYDLVQDLYQSNGGVWKIAGTADQGGSLATAVRISIICWKL